MPTASAEQVVFNHFILQTEGGWNRFPGGNTIVGEDHTPVWTHEGWDVDAIRFYGDICNGCDAGKVPFKVEMSPEQIVEAFRQGAMRDGSQVTVLKQESVTFVGQPGFRAEYELLRAGDGTVLRGLLYGAVVNTHLYLVDYSAPRLLVFPRDVAQVEELMRTAKAGGHWAR